MIKILSASDVAHRLGLSARGVTKLCRSGFITSQRIGKRQWAILESDLAGFVPPTRGRIPKARQVVARPPRHDPMGVK